MTKILTPEERDAKNKAVAKALDMVVQLCRREREWVMSVPARHDYDPDIVIADGLRVASDVLDNAAAADELIGELVRALQVSECYCRCGIHGLAYIGQDHVPQPECSRMFCKRCAALARAKAEGYGG